MKEDPTSNFHNPLSEDSNMKMGFVDDYVCAICDEGGRLICCDGECGRLFHPNRYDGTDSNCITLELSDDQEKLSKFLCKNCEYKQHQCFACGELGSSNMSSGWPEVFQCNKKNCWRFYHLKCLPGYDESKRLPYFECPMHECCLCKNKRRKVTREQTTKVRKGARKSEGEEMHLVLCRRCPIAYHWKCLPRKHEMAEDLRSATRNHLKFPEVEEAHRVNDNVEDQEKPAIEECPFDLNLPPPEQNETPQHNAPERNASSSHSMLSFASRSLFPCPWPGKGGWVDN